jgi:hypothetical protein
VVLLLIDDRYLRDRPVPFSWARRLSVPRLFKPGPGVTREETDSLYSELIVLQ